MKLEEILKKVDDFDSTDDIDLTIFFDEIGSELFAFFPVDTIEREMILTTLFDFLKNRDPEMEENFSFIHLIESIDKPDYKIYNKRLIDFNLKNGALTSVLLLNRYINSIEKEKNKENLEILKSIANNINYTDLVRKEALRLYKYQINK